MNKNEEISTKPLVNFAGNGRAWTIATLDCAEIKSCGDGKYSCGNKIEISEKKEQFGSVTRITYTAENVSSEDVMLEHVSSGCFEKIGGGLIPWYDDRKYVLHRCYFTWQGEAQWRESSLSELGLYRASNHNYVNPIILRSVGNQSTALCYPLIFIEDKELGKTYFFELENTGSWYIEIGANYAGDLKVELNSAFCNNDNWHMSLKPGEKYTASSCIYGVVYGGFEKAVAELTDYRRETSEASLKTMPVCFNDYMNCLWAMPSEKKLIPLIDKAAEVGCEVFCIDAGWQVPMDFRSTVLGDWSWEDGRFGEYGFSGIIDYIKGKGLKPGIWLELNSVTENSEIFKNHGDCVLKRNGKFTGSSDRYQIDFRKQAVTEHMTKVIDRLYGLGIRFIKNDYNQTCGIGFDGEKSSGEEMRENSLAFEKFIDGIRDKYSDLIIENCASGSMRTDNSIMRHFHLVSVSDQEYYYNNPAILTGMAACVQPEKCGSWAYPYPLYFENRMDDPKNSVKTGEAYSSEETVFNMINSMLGIMYLSGHIELADDKNTALISEAVQLYKKNRDFVKSAYPIYPCGRIRIDKDGFYAYGLADKCKNKILLAVWRINSTEDTKYFDLSEYTNADSSVKVIYPAEEKTDFVFSNGMLSVKLSSNYSARLFEITN